MEKAPPQAKDLSRAQNEKHEGQLIRRAARKRKLDGQELGSQASGHRSALPNTGPRELLTIALELSVRPKDRSLLEVFEQAKLLLQSSKQSEGGRDPSPRGGSQSRDRDSSQGRAQSRKKKSKKHKCQKHRRSPSPSDSDSSSASPSSPPRATKSAGRVRREGRLTCAP